VVSRGFSADSDELAAPDYQKERVKWIASEDSHPIIAALTADILWDWIYIDELWVARELRGQGLGQKLMGLAETFARSRDLRGIWLWTQSWQAEAFYRKLGYRQTTFQKATREWVSGSTWFRLVVLFFRATRILDGLIFLAVSGALNQCFVELLRVLRAELAKLFRLSNQVAGAGG